MRPHSCGSMAHEARRPHVRPQDAGRDPVDGGAAGSRRRERSDGDRFVWIQPHHDKWLKASSGRGRGLKALRGTRGSGRRRKLTAAQERQVFRWINGRDPRQYGQDFGLWTRAIVVTLIEQKFGVRLGVTAVGTLLAKLGLTPQKPLQRAYQRDGAAIERWQRETYPGIAQQAKQEDAEIFFRGESGFRADTVHGKTWGLRGKTPVVHRAGRRQSVSAASAVNSRGLSGSASIKVHSTQTCLSSCSRK